MIETAITPCMAERSTAAVATCVLVGSTAVATAVVSHIHVPVRVIVHECMGVGQRSEHSHRSCGGSIRAISCCTVRLTQYRQSISTSSYQNGLSAVKVYIVLQYGFPYSTDRAADLKKFYCTVELFQGS